MKKNPLIQSGISIVILGFGVTGRAAAKYLHSLGVKVFISDSKQPENLNSDEKQFIEKYCVDFEGNGHTRDFLLKGDILFLSPGIPIDLEILQDRDIRLIKKMGELSLAAHMFQCKVIAITGTNGKTTVTTLIGELLEKAGMRVFVGGNIGTPILEHFMDEKDIDIAVLEVSSFQLELSEGFAADIGILLNITPDHIDRHGSEAAYFLAKKTLFDNQRDNGIAILNSNNLICRELAEQLGNGRVLTYGHDRGYSAYICESEIIIRIDDTVEKYTLTDTQMDNLMGRENSAAAILAVRSAGCDMAEIQKGLNEFKTLKHRMQIVDTKRGVVFINDSKATNTGAVAAALRQVSGRVVLIAGGRDKGDDYRLLRIILQEKVNTVVLIGEAAAKIDSQIGDIVPTIHSSSMEDAVGRAAEIAKSGDTVLLSPACASFDMFRSYGERGEKFIEAVAELS